MISTTEEITGSLKMIVRFMVDILRIPDSARANARMTMLRRHGNA
ncbi:MAG: hypothetical protein U9N46_12880 [Euryarchaeota archaeon]|nr:hypothetical protein [Euryarchaeota archaeon]